MKDAREFRRELALYVAGLVTALALTATAFAIVAWRLASPGVALGWVFGLGLVQIVVHFRTFLHIDLRRNAREDLLLILFSTLIIALMVGGTLVIMLNLRHRMM